MTKDEKKELRKERLKKIWFYTWRVLVIVIALWYMVSMIRGCTSNLTLNKSNNVSEKVSINKQRNNAFSNVPKAQQWYAKDFSLPLGYFGTAINTNDGLVLFNDSNGYFYIGIRKE